MAETSITKVSTKGQVVIPQDLREEMKIKPSDEFLIYGEKDTILMKKIEKTSLEEDFYSLSKRLQKKAKKLGITRKDVEEAIREVRKKSQ
ncbi:MAG: AbrB/MazE/SpoVT family DNA-binding domain-containing protein [archaeon]|nr:AbrB/MazE/SpoVT family DNA-binding domain-containing protein [archaeon]